MRYVLNWLYRLEIWPSALSVNANSSWVTTAGLRENIEPFDAEQSAKTLAIFQASDYLQIPEIPVRYGELMIELVRNRSSTLTKNTDQAVTAVDVLERLYAVGGTLDAATWAILVSRMEPNVLARFTARLRERDALDPKFLKEVCIALGGLCYQSQMQIQRSSGKTFVPLRY
ncbi:hypothetical protein TWF694_002686 [Orbilia ellipsospora]|uniref:Uncharacterized protein n=1 Tax=Orbilia ellipsospora TaxID=2528407 RepID=A0AAV9X3U9_9PEZI